jgi:hypothetical protein
MTYALITVVDVRSYSLISGSTSELTKSGSPGALRRITSTIAAS